MKTIALVGNQNTGKTTLFNKLTGSNRKVGNFPGVTVDVAIGELKGNKEYRLIDLPGVYSLSPCSEEERLTRDYLQTEQPDCIINILDATNLNRNMYLTMQLLEAQTPIIMALNMADELEKNGTHIDTIKLSKILDTDVIPVSATKGTGIEKLIKNTISLCNKPSVSKHNNLYNSPQFTAIKGLTNMLKTANPALNEYAGINYLEQDIPPYSLDDSTKIGITNLIAKIEKEFGTDTHAIIADMRYSAITDICHAVINKAGINKSQLLSEKIDNILTHKYLAIPIFLAVMGLVFYLTFGLIGKYISDSLSSGVDIFSHYLSVFLQDKGVSAWLVSLIIDGMLAGVGSVMSFLPMIILLFFFLSIIEDTGYMARVAFVMDRLLKKIGLTGRSIVPMLIGFGCSVPAYMSIRTLPTEKDKKLTAYMIPFMSCSAKIPIYAIFTTIFFAKYQALVMLLLYTLGIVVGILYAYVWQRFVYKSQDATFVMELPPYRMPSRKTVTVYLFDKAKSFITKAFTIIFLASVIIWFMQNFGFDWRMVANAENSMLAIISKKIAIIFKPLGFGDWRFSTAIITGLIAKEAVISTLFILFETNLVNFGSVITASMTTIQALSFLAFFALYMPCIAAYAALKKELKSTRHALFAMAMQNLVAYMVSFFIYTTCLVLFI